MTQIYLATADRSRVIKFPIPPAEISVNSGMETKTYNTVGSGETLFIGRRTLSEISWSSFFPAKHVFYEQSNAMHGVEYITALEHMRDNREPLRLTVSALGISIDCVIKTLKWSQRRGNDIYYDITLLEYRGVQ